MLSVRDEFRSLRARGKTLLWCLVVDGSGYFVLHGEQAVGGCCLLMSFGSVQTPHLADITDALLLMLNECK